MALGKKTGGRKKGTLNKVQSPIKDAAREYTRGALETLAAVMKDESHPAAARVSAANAILDRGYGKPKQAITGDEDGAPIGITAITRTIVDPKNIPNSKKTNGAIA